MAANDGLKAYHICGIIAFLSFFLMMGSCCACTGDIKTEYGSEELYIAGGQVRSAPHTTSTDPDKGLIFLTLGSGLVFIVSSLWGLGSAQAADREANMTPEERESQRLFSKAMDRLSPQERKEFWKKYNSDNSYDLRKEKEIEEMNRELKEQGLPLKPPHRSSKQRQEELKRQREDWKRKSAEMDRQYAEMDREEREYDKDGI